MSRQEQADVNCRYLQLDVVTCPNLKRLSRLLAVDLGERSGLQELSHLHDLLLGLVADTGDVDDCYR